MRIIAGLYRSRPLVAPRGSATRPSSDRLRESLFNILAPRIEGSHFADLYAGTGAIGIEALSRGAAHVLFVEKAPPALAALRANLKALEIPSGFTIEARSVASVLDRIHETPRTGALNLVFLDPPWEAADEYTSVLSHLGAARTRTLLAPGAFVIAEHAARNPLQPSWGALVQTRTLRQGDAALTFYALREPAGDQPENAAVLS